ncbi:MAG: hypothetical protein H0W02_22875 [Ktedonobacteraceae bacterium]|nr:hypothetical protein [Ktedonobacteraceae bacterium]
MQQAQPGTDMLASGIDSPDAGRDDAQMQHSPDEFDYVFYDIYETWPFVGVLFAEIASKLWQYIRKRNKG